MTSDGVMFKFLGSTSEDMGFDPYWNLYTTHGDEKDLEVHISRSKTKIHHDESRDEDIKSSERIKNLNSQSTESYDLYKKGKISRTWNPY